MFFDLFWNLLLWIFLIFEKDNDKGGQEDERNWEERKVSNPIGQIHYRYLTIFIFRGLISIYFHVDVWWFNIKEKSSYWINTYVYIVLYYFKVKEFRNQWYKYIRSFSMTVIFLTLEINEKKNKWRSNMTDHVSRLKEKRERGFSHPKMMIKMLFKSVIFFFSVHIRICRTLKNISTTCFICMYSILYRSFFNCEFHWNLFASSHEKIIFRNSISYKEKMYQSDSAWRTLWKIQIKYRKVKLLVNIMIRLLSS